MSVCPDSWVQRWNWNARQDEEGRPAFGYGRGSFLTDVVTHRRSESSSDAEPRRVVPKNGLSRSLEGSLTIQNKTVSGVGSEPLRRLFRRGREECQVRAFPKYDEQKDERGSVAGASWIA